MGFFNFAFAVLLFLFSSGCIQKASVQKKHEFIFWNIGQGDLATYIGLNNCITFDVGGNLNINYEQKKYIFQNCKTKNNSLIISHFDLDHIRQYKTLHKLVGFNQVYAPLTKLKTKQAKNFVQFFNHKKINLIYVTAGKSKVLTHLESENFKINFISHPEGNTENSKSLILLLKINNTKVLMTGDLPSKNEPLIKENLNVDILKVAHHGSRYSSSETFLKKTNPKTCIISVGKNTYGHPHVELIKRLHKFNCAALRTDYLNSVKLNF